MKKPGTRIYRDGEIRGEGLGTRDNPPWSAIHPSPWSCSITKRLFDCGCVLLALPLLVPACLVIALAVRLTSPGPVLFLQERMGGHGRIFTIFKFRTMIHVSDTRHNPVTTADSQRFTPVGAFLRRWKLDELPQLFNVLLGHMSLVGPRPKLPEHVKFDFYCRPGITGAATIAFAHEEQVLDRVPKQHLDDYYHYVVLPAKRMLDSNYMARATFLSDLKIIFNSVVRRWDSSVMYSLLNKQGLEIVQEFSAADELSEIEGTAEIKGLSLIDWISAIGLGAAGVLVLFAVSKLAHVNWHYIVLFFALVAGIWFMSARAYATVVKDKRNRDLRVSELYERIGK